MQINNYILFLSPIYMTSIMLLFIVSGKWRHDSILLTSVISSVFCLLFYSSGYINLAIITICVSNTTLIFYSMFVRRRNV